MNSNYYCIGRFQTLKFHKKNKSLSLFHINACSLSKNFDDVLDIVAVSETRINRKTSLTSNINLQNYSFESTPTESNAGGTLLYIANFLPYKTCMDLSLNKANQLNLLL